MLPDVDIRIATVDDIPVIARHRAAMFVAMGALPHAFASEMEDLTKRYLELALPAGEYVGWLAYAGGVPGDVVAGAGVQRRRTLPSPAHPPQRPGVNRGYQALVINVFTEPGFRRRGIARRLMTNLIEWAAAESIESIVLHAAAEGRPLYESLGFSATSEMRLFPTR
jgi:GNAT superfamily N-acetyltransferase